jgi:hypothetical protein
MASEIDLIINFVFIDLFHIRMTYILSCDIFLDLNKKVRCNARGTKLVF